MSKINMVFERLSIKKEKALIPYVCCGDPNLNFTRELVCKFSAEGADIIELGIPYSDPIADGPIIQRAGQRALSAGARIEEIFEMVAALRPMINTPLVIMTYYNPIYRYGVGQFVQKAVDSGIDGLIVPDLPMEEFGELKMEAARSGIDLILMVAPTSSEQRIKKIAERSQGFLYCVADTGVTGSRKSLAAGLNYYISRVRRLTEMPLAVGFGVSGPETARSIARFADGVIVGSSIIEKIESRLDMVEKSPELAAKEVAEYVGRLKEAVR